jgi:hypothetical protein
MESVGLIWVSQSICFKKSIPSQKNRTMKYEPTVMIRLNSIKVGGIQENGIKEFIVPAMVLPPAS